LADDAASAWRSLVIAESIHERRESMEWSIRDKEAERPHWWTDSLESAQPFERFRKVMARAWAIHKITDPDKLAKLRRLREVEAAARSGLKQDDESLAAVVAALEKQRDDMGGMIIAADFIAAMSRQYGLV